MAQGFSQKHGLDYDETFSPVVRFESLQTVIALSVQYSLKLHQMDVTTAFLKGELEEEVYMRQPDGFIAKGQEGFVCKLKRSVYGLQQSPRCWNSALDSQLRKMGFVQAPSDLCIYMASEGEQFIVGVDVDDILLVGKSDKRIAEVKRPLQEVPGEGHGGNPLLSGSEGYSGPKIWRSLDWSASITRSILQRYGMGKASTPVDTSVKLVKASEDTNSVDQRLYQSAVGSLLYLSTRTRPDITYAVSSVAKYFAKPINQHWIAVKHIMQHLQGTLNSFTARVDQMRVETLMIVWLPVPDQWNSWRSKKQTCVALSTVEAE